MARDCSCGSGKPRYDLVDAAGVFCTYVCEDCEEKKRSNYDPRIFTHYYDADQQEPDWPEQYDNDALGG